MAPERGRSILAATMIGVGVMAALDEIVLHQILGWHHFYDRSTTGIALLSDGLLHATELIVIVGGTSCSPTYGDGRLWLRAQHGRDSCSAWGASNCSTAWSITRS